ncbi:UDP-N-acetylmuramoyl-L-alanine--D-glutamate ligase [Chlamydiota bacterium]
MRAIVLGLGVSGRAAASFLKSRGDEVLGVDRSEPVLDGIRVVSDAGAPQLEGVSLFVKSPGISFAHPWVKAALSSDIPVVGEIDLALAELAGRGKRVLAITGSNGKTTTTLLAAHLLQTNGTRALAAGNVGIPLLSQIDGDFEVFVVELSSFQLEAIVVRPVFDGALILNITPNHLDRHPSFEDYIQAKLRIALCLKEGAPLYVTEQVKQVCNTQMIKNLETILPLGYRDNRYRLYPHDLENAAAAFALTGVPLGVLQRGIDTFVRPPHRLEFVREVAGVKYINDSKATSVDAVIKAVRALDSPLVLIAGGVDKGGEYSDWLPHFRGKVKAVLALGAAAERIERELGQEMRVQKINSLQEGVQIAASLASKGDTVLLSPGCSSYDQFRDYQQRGERFTHIVREML